MRPDFRGGLKYAAGGMLADIGRIYHAPFDVIQIRGGRLRGGRGGDKEARLSGKFNSAAEIMRPDFR